MFNEFEKKVTSAQVEITQPLNNHKFTPHEHAGVLAFKVYPNLLDDFDIMYSIEIEPIILTFNHGLNKIIVLWLFFFGVRALVIYVQLTLYSFHFLFSNKSKFRSGLCLRFLFGVKVLSKTAKCFKAI